MINEDFPNAFIEVCRAVEQRIKGSSFSIIAIGGTVGVGKTTLARYLSWKLGLSLLEMDLFLRPIEAKVRHDYKYVQEILEYRKKAQQHIIIEGCSILPALCEFDANEIFLIYIENNNSGLSSVDQYYVENTETCSINEIPDVDLNSDCPSDLIEKANLTISWKVN